MVFAFRRARMRSQNVGLARDFDVGAHDLRVSPGLREARVHPHLHRLFEHVAETDDEGRHQRDPEEHG